MSTESEDLSWNLNRSR